MSKEESIYIGKRISDKEFEAYMERMDDPKVLSDERWWHIYLKWFNHCLDITWDGSFYDNILIQIKEGHEATIREFIELRYQEGNLTLMMETFVPLTKENYQEILYPTLKKKEKVKQRFSKEQYFEFFKRVESNSYTPSKYTKQDHLILKGSSYRPFKREYIRKWRFDDFVSEACEMLLDEQRMDEIELLDILKPPSDFYAQALINRVIYHINNSKGDYFKKTHKLLVKEGAKKIKIFVVDRKD